MVAKRWVVRLFLLTLVAALPLLVSDAFWRPRLDGWAYVIGRALAVPGAPNIEGPYARSFTRRHVDHKGQATDFLLVDTAARETALARELLAQGFVREALFHASNVTAFYGGTPEAAEALRIADRGRGLSVFEAAKGCPIVEISGRRAVAIPGTPPDPLDPAGAAERVRATPLAFSLHYRAAEMASGLEARLHARRALELVRLPALPVLSLAATQVTSVVDDDGCFTPSTKAATRPEGSLLLEIEGANLYAAELAYKRRFLVFARRILGPSAELDRACVYFGLVPEKRRDELVRFADLFGFAPGLGVAALSKSRDRRLAYLRAHLLGQEPPDGVDGRYLARLRAHPRLRVEVPSTAVDGPELPISLLAMPSKSVRFRFERLPHPPALESAMKGWLEDQKAATLPFAFEETIPSSSRRLPIREPGAYRVRAEAGGLSLTFFAVRVDARIRTLHFPSETLTMVARADGTPIPGLAFSQGGTRLGVTDAGGVLRGVVLPSVRPDHVSRPAERHCAEHRECCSGCDTCWHHHGETTPLLIAGPGAFFRTIPVVDTSEVDAITPPRREATLFVYTDRPAYRAGDPLRFRGVLRAPKQDLRPADESRWEAPAGRPVTVSIVRDGESIFQRTYLTGEFGTFAGEASLPLSTTRAEYELVVSSDGTRASAAFEVIDYRRLDYSIVLTPVEGGLHVKAGFVWGEPVPDSIVKATVGAAEVPVRDGVVPAVEGDVVRVVLLRGTEELASKTMKVRAGPRPKLELDKAARAPVEPPRADGRAAAPASAPAITASKVLYGDGDAVELEVRGPDGPGLVVLGDVQAYDWRAVTLRDGRATVSFPASAIYDPGVTAFAVVGGRVERLAIAVRSKAMGVEVVPDKASARPGEEVGVTVKARPRAAVSLAAVDEAVYMVREDETAEMYPVFHVKRPAAMAVGAATSVSYDAYQDDVEGVLRDAALRVVHRQGGAIRRLGRGMYGREVGGRQMRVSLGGGGSATEDACLWSLKALARFQADDGSFGPAALATEFGTVNEVGNTGWALLAFLGAGYSHLSRDVHAGISFGDLVRRAIQYLLSRQSSDGLIGARSGDWLVNHAVAALALSEAYGLTGSTLFKDGAQRAIDCLAAAQSGDGGWSAGGRADSDSGTTTLAVMALRSADLASLTLPRAAAQSAVRYFDAATDDDGITASTLAADAAATRMTVAGGMLARMLLLRDKRDPRLVKAAATLVTSLPSATRPDYEGWYFAGLSLFDFDGPSGPAWTRFNSPVKTALLSLQRNGLWTLDGSRADAVFRTALGTLTLEVYYRYANVFGGVGGERAAGKAQAPLAVPTKIRIHFPDTVLWEPELMTDARGEARVTVPMPDSITTVRLTARGVTRDTAVGEGVGRIESRQPFFVNLHSPAFFVEGDECEIRGEIFNYTGSDSTVTATLSGDGFTIAGTAAQRVTVGAEPRRVTWRIRAGAPGRARFVVDVGRDAVEKSIAILPASAPVTRSIRGREIEIASDERPLDLVVRARPGQSPLARILEALRYLNDYPHG